MIRLANAPVSWGVDEFARASFKPWNEVLDEIARAGYAGTELGPYGYLPTDTARLKQELARRGLALISAFIPRSAAP